MYKAIIYNNEVDLRANRGTDIVKEIPAIATTIKLARKESIKKKDSYGLVRDDKGRCHYMYEESSDMECYYIPRNGLYSSVYNCLSEVSRLVDIPNGSLVVYDICEGSAKFKVVDSDNKVSDININELISVLNLLHDALTCIPKSIDSVIIPAKLYMMSANMECFYAHKRGSNKCYLAFMSNFEVPWVNLKG